MSAPLQRSPIQDLPANTELFLLSFHEGPPGHVTFKLHLHLQNLICTRTWGIAEGLLNAAQLH